jgi:hypothetical protein
MNKNKTNQELAVEILTIISGWFIYAFFIWLGWKVLVTHFGLPYFTYWEVFAIRMGFGSILKIFQRCFNINKA